MRHYINETLYFYNDNKDAVYAELRIKVPDEVPGVAYYTFGVWFTKADWGFKSIVAPNSLDAANVLAYANSILEAIKWSKKLFASIDWEKINDNADN